MHVLYALNTTYSRQKSLIFVCYFVKYNWDSVNPIFACHIKFGMHDLFNTVLWMENVLGHNVYDNITFFHCRNGPFRPVPCTMGVHFADVNCYALIAVFINKRRKMFFFEFIFQFSICTAEAYKNLEIISFVCHNVFPLRLCFVALLIVVCFYSFRSFWISALMRARFSSLFSSSSV